MKARAPSAMRMRRDVRRGAYRLDDGTFRDGPMAQLGTAMALWVAGDADQGTGVEIDNVLAYLLGRHGAPVDISEFHSARPPWDRAWLEGEMPTNTGIPRCAVRVAASADAPAILRTNAGMRASMPGLEGFTFDIEDGQTLLVSMLYSWHPDYRSVVGPEGGAYTVLDADGSVARDHAGGWRTMGFCFDSSGDEAYQNAVVTLATFVPLFTFEFANCQNVRLVEATEELSRQQLRHRARQDDPPDRWYTLEIGGPTARSLAAAPANADMAHLPKRLHICRGHFATYTEAAPLFGKYVGRFWVPAHTRGALATGTVTKDYRIARQEPSPIMSRLPALVVDPG